MIITNKSVFITGGAGFLGENLVKKYYNNNYITVFSRDENKHYYLKKKYPNIKTIIGDIRDYENLSNASIGADVAIFAASMKQIESVQKNDVEALKTIIIGAENSRKVSIENHINHAAFISSDKSRSATTLYGAMKFVAGEMFINSEVRGQNLSTVIYGNVLNSTGSVIPLIWRYILQKEQMILYSEEMTRFVIDIDTAISTIEHSLDYNGVNIIPNLKSIRIVDLFEIYKEKFGLMYKIGRPRVSEKIHESLISKEESYRTQFEKNKNIYIMYPHYELQTDVWFLGKEYSSEYCVMSKNELESILKENNYFSI